MDVGLPARSPKVNEGNRSGILGSGWKGSTSVLAPPLLPGA